MKNLFLSLTLILIGASTFASNTSNLKEVDGDFYGQITITETSQKVSSDIVFSFESKTEMDNFDFTKLSEMVSGDCDISVTLETNIESVSSSVTVTKHGVDSSHLAQETKKLYEHLKSSIKEVRKNI